MFKKIFVENELKSHPKTIDILSKLAAGKSEKINYIDKYDEVFGKVKKPYLQKRDNLNLFIAKKRGTLVKEAPDAYGLGEEKHFYFINSYNCIYECEYCYLQGFFNSPDIVIFINWDDIKKDIADIANKHKGSWFHAGEFSDSLALSNLTGELSNYYQLFKNIPEAKLELRTKSINIREALKFEPLNNIYFSFSISTEKSCREVDLKTPPMKHRLKAIQSLQAKGHNVGLHFDPIIWTPNWAQEHEELVEYLDRTIELSKISYVSIGVVRFTDNVYYQFKKNYPDSTIHQGELKRSFDNKIRYPKAMRNKILRFLKEILTSKGIEESIIYECME